jgi:hypothetical protein
MVSRGVLLKKGKMFWRQEKRGKIVTQKENWKNLSDEVIPFIIFFPHNLYVFASNQGLNQCSEGSSWKEEVQPLWSNWVSPLSTAGTSIQLFNLSGKTCP